MEINTSTYRMDCLVNYSKVVMRLLLGLLPLVGSLGSLLKAKPFFQSSVTFVSPGYLSPESVHNVHVEYSGDVDGELTITYGSCGDIIISDARQRIGATHVGGHPLAARHVDHEERRPTRFVWLTPSIMSGGCLYVFLDNKPLGRSDELLITKRMACRSEKKSFADVAGTDSMWFNGGMTHDAVCRGLHGPTRALRDRVYNVKHQEAPFLCREKGDDTGPNGPVVVCNDKP